MELLGKTALVTGGAKRIGKAIALALAREGMNLLLHYHHSLREAKETQREAECLGAGVHLLQADLGSFAGVQRLLRKSFQASAEIQVLVNNASIFYPTPLGRIREKDWDPFFDVNLKAPFFLSQAVGLKMFKRKQGKIINLIDWTAFRPKTSYLPYCASKAALAAVTEGLAKALAPHVQVNGIAPGPILKARGSTAKDNKKVADRTPLKRFGEPGDIAEAVRFLVKSTDFVTGAILPIDGGNLIA